MLFPMASATPTPEGSCSSPKNLCGDSTGNTSHVEEALTSFDHNEVTRLRDFIALHVRNYLEAGSSHSLSPTEAAHMTAVQHALGRLEPPFQPDADSITDALLETATDAVKPLSASSPLSPPPATVADGSPPSASNSTQPTAADTEGAFTKDTSASSERRVLRSGSVPPPPPSLQMQQSRAASASSNRQSHVGTPAPQERSK